MSRTRKLSKIAEQVSITRFLDYREYLEAIYKACKEEYEAYSYLSFAEDLGFSKTNVIHLIIKGKRPLSTKAAEKIAEILELKVSERKYLLDLAAYQGSRDSIEREKIFQEIVEIKSREIRSEESLSDQLEFYTEWYHSAIYELAFSVNFVADPKELAALLRPRIRPEQARKSLELLVRLGLLEPCESSKSFRPTQGRITTGDEIASLAITRYHQRMIELGKESLTSTPGTLRDVSSISVSIPESMIPLLKQEISAFRKRILALAEQAPDRETVYQMNVQLFPLTRNKGTPS